MLPPDPVARPVYLDNHATTPMDPRVLEAMLPYFCEKFGNAASRTHVFGSEAEDAVEDARREVAELIGAEAREVIFTSGATESDNLAIKGTLARLDDGQRHIVTATTEHKAVLDTCRALEKQGRARVTYLRVSPQGEIDLDALRAAIGPDTGLVSLMLANNEIGTIHPLAEIGRLTREKGVLLHVDASQGSGLLPVDVRAMEIDLLSLTAHKIYGPKGVGALFVRARDPRVRVEPEIRGGGHERGMRSGTLNVPGIVGFGRACGIARESRDAEAARLAGLRDRLQKAIVDGLDGVRVHGATQRRHPGNLNVGFDGVDGESLLLGLPEIAVSSGSACTSATLEPSYVLRAIGLSDRQAHSSLRFGVGRFNGEAEIDFAASRVCEVVTRLRGMAAARRLARRAASS
jgi:cysteine desulfurase